MHTTPSRLALVMAAAIHGCVPGASTHDLAEHERKVFSQFGEDGVIERIFEIIPPTNKFAVEFGAVDGVKNSNTRNLIINHGWSALLIEGANTAAALKKNYEAVERVKTLRAWVYPGNVEILFEENGVPEDLDFLVIDIDSNDYYVWRAIQSFRPKVVQLEANPAFPPPQRMVIQFHPMNYWDGSDYYGASAQSLYELSKKKGYELIYHSRDGNNIFFVDRQYYDRFGIEDNSPDKIYTPTVFRKRKDRPRFLPVKQFRIPKKVLDHR